MKSILIKMIGVIIMVATASQAGAVVPSKKMVRHVRTQFRKYAPTRITAGLWSITDKDEKFLGELIKAANIMDDIFLRQVWENNPQIRVQLTKDKTGERQLLLKFFDLNAGPFDRLDNHRSFLNIGMEYQPPTAGFYPKSLKKEEWEAWIKRHPGKREDFESTYTIIERDGKNLKATPYSKYYAKWLKRAAGHLREAAKHTGHTGLKKYLKSRAKAFETNDYFQSDMDWMDLKGHKFEVVIGPYEVYEDRFMGYKAAFEAFISMVDKKDTAKLERMKSYMGEFENRLPIDGQYKNTKRGKLSPIVVAQLIYSAGDAKAGIQTLAFNLPNDERVREAKGSKKVLLKNVSEAKFKEILIPIAKLNMDKKDAADVSFDAFFNHTLLHEVSHGIGPGTITVMGKETTVNKALKDLYSVIEEAKADTLGLYNNIYLIDKGMHPKGSERTYLATYLAGLFRSMRFGISAAHGGGNAIQFNYLKKKGGIAFDKKTKKFRIDEEKMREGVRDLAHDLLMIEAEGDYASAKKFVGKYRRMPKELKASLARLGAVPVDIRPIYSTKFLKKK